MNPNTEYERFINRRGELQQLAEAMRRRQSLLIWGPPDAGKTALVHALMGRLPEERRRSCFYLQGPAHGRELASQLVERLHAVGDPHVRAKVSAAGAGADSLRHWLGGQTSGQLRNLLFTAARSNHYSIFLDDFPPASHAMTRLMKEIIWRGKTPVYLIACGSSRAEIGHAWSIYFAPEYCLHVGSLLESSARELLQACIHRFGLASFDLDGFREEILESSGLLPGRIVGMCRLAADPRFRHGDKVKAKLIHIEYLMRARLADADEPRRGAARTAL